MFGAILTDATCGDACWHAREEVCRCSCGGRNHGCLKTGAGEQPVRTCKIAGDRYRLEGVGAYSELIGPARERNATHGITYVYAYSDRNSPGVANIRYPSESQRKWPECASLSRADGALLWVRDGEPLADDPAYRALVEVKRAEREAARAERERLADIQRAEWAAEDAREALAVAA